MSFRTALVIAVIVIFISMGSAGQETGKKEVIRKPAPPTSMASGKQMYTSYCASCHGTKGTGDGPAASAMKNPPSDLTALARQNKGEFPYARVQQAIRGDVNLPAHGSKDMPVWGPLFWSMDKESAAVQLRVKNLTDYVKSLQKM